MRGTLVDRRDWTMTYGVVWVLLPAAIFGDGGMTAEEATVDGGDCAIKFHEGRPEEVGRLGVLNFTFC
jgi:hypothetical protein